MVTKGIIKMYKKKYSGYLLQNKTLLVMEQ